MKVQLELESIPKTTLSSGTFIILEKVSDRLKDKKTQSSVKKDQKRRKLNPHPRREAV